MKKRHLIRLLPLAFLVGCAYEPLEHPDNPNASDFSIADARTFFEANATDLQNVKFGPKVKSHNCEDENIVPDWKAAKTFRREKITTVEIPLGGSVNKAAQISATTPSKILYRITSRVTVKLIVQKHDEIETPRQFVVTMIDGLAERSNLSGPDNCYGNNRYNGLIIVSALTGEYLESFRSVNGRWTRTYIAPGPNKDSEEPLTSMRLLGMDASPATYSFGEEDPSNCPRCGNVNSMCTCCKVCGGEGCDECMATVYPTCPRCKYQGPGPCRCCPVCRHYPCTCNNHEKPDPVWRCPHCGDQYCIGQCQGGSGKKPDPEKPKDDDDDDEEEEEECTHEKCQGCGRFVGTPTRASQCDTHEYCENNGECVKVVVSLSKSEVTLGEEYTIALKLTPSNTVCLSISYYIVQNGEEYALEQPNGQFLKLTTMARVPGNFQIKGEIIQEGSEKTFSGISSNIKQTYPTRTEILQQTAVTKGMEEAWQKTLAAVTSTTSQEFGGFAVINTRDDNTGDLYRFEHREGIPTPYTDSVTTIPLKFEGGVFKPNQGGEFAVLLFHTHPPLWAYEGSKTLKRRVGPSKPDIDEHTTMPAVVKDFDHPSGWIYSNMPRAEYEKSTKLYQYGPERKIK